ncbi:MAG TPA: TolC family protein, partial [Pseudomonadales bacterium]|nr:TolC family protein [Pseudomonadales bacterium]
DLTQTRLEEFEFRDELVKAEDAAARAQLALATFLGPQNDRLVGAEGRLEQPPASYDLTNLISRALEQRPDLLALRHAEEAASNSVDLARSKIVPDVDLGVTYGYNGPVAVDHPVDPTPSFHQLGVTVTMTLPLYDRGQHDVAIARSQVEQAKAQFAAAQTKVEIEVRTADSQYRSALQRAAAFRSDVLASATAVLDAKRYSYQRGGSTLLELLSAQRAANDVQQAYQDALAEVATALIELQRATGDGELKF